MKPIVLEAGDERRARGSAMGPCPAVLAVGIQHRPRGRAAARSDRMEFAGPAAVSDRRRTGGALSRAAGDANRAGAITSRHRAASPTSAASASTSSRARDASSAPFEIRYQNGKGPEVVRADAVIDASGTWHSPNPAGANGLPAIGERAGGKPHRLRHARRAGQATRSLCRQDRRRAGRGTLGDRHADRSGAACRTGAGTRGRSGFCGATIPPRRSAAAPTTSSPRAANWAAHLPQLVAAGKMQVETRFSRLAHRRRTAPRLVSAPARLLRPSRRGRRT